MAHSPTRRDFLRLSAAAGAIVGTGVNPLLAGCGPGAEPADASSSAPPRPLNILVLGGTQFIGPHLVDYALERGHNVTLFNRGRSNTHLFPDLEKLVGDRDDNLTALKGRSWDVAIDTHATLPRWVRQSAQQLRDSVSQYVFVSTISVYADASEPWADEATILEVLEDPNDETASNGANYGAHKAAAEAEARMAFPETALIVRPGLIVGPGDITDRWGYWPVRINRGGDVLAPGDGSDNVQFIDARDLTGWIVRMVERERPGTFNATGPETEVSMAAMLAELQTIAANPSSIHWADAEWLGEHGVRRWSEMPVWIGSGPDTSGFLRRNIGKALAEGLTFRPMLDTARDTLAWQAARPAEEQSPMRSGLTPERETELLAALRA